VLIALGCDLVIAAIKFVASCFTGSSGMSSEGVHSLIDASTELILLYGLMMSRRGATADHQLGFGREVYFWNFVVALLMFALGSGVTLISGLRQIIHPAPLDHAWINFFVLALSAAVETTGLWAALKKSNATRGSDSLYRFFYRRRDPTSLTIFFGGIAGILGLVATTIGLILSQFLNNDAFDGIASVAISLILGVTAWKLAMESKSLLIGVPADPELVQEIIACVDKNSGVCVVNGMISVHLAPEQLMVALSVSFDVSLTSGQVEGAIADIEDKLHVDYPQIVALFIKPQSPERYAAVHGSSAPLTSYVNSQTVSSTPYASV
jgi:cation diffusion facilitator family transporter